MTDNLVDQEIMTAPRSRFPWARVRSANLKLAGANGTRMHLRELLGIVLAIFAFLIAAGGLWAARHFSAGRKYARMRAGEKRAQRARRSGE